MPAKVRTALLSKTALTTRLKAVKLFLCDVDGILTDASVHMGDAGEMKRFNIQDGLGLRLLQHEGIKVGWISNRPSYSTTQRALDLKVDFLYQADGHKVEAAQNILEKAGLDWKDCSYMGDDIVDIGLLKRAGLAISVPNAIPEARRAAHYVTTASGGEGAVREVVHMILKAQKKWDTLVARFSK
jgi:3-deoxy-D-manno-octulosonate 8-phosphate phosphatase (KDO 8-P phosphatase)